METEKSTFSLLSADEETTLRGIQVSPEGTPRAMVQIVHGMAEYTGRYIPLMTALAERGYLCFGHDHIGHGDSEPIPGKRGHMERETGADTLVKDTLAVAREMQERYTAGHPDQPPLPCILLGHSMGSFVVRCAVAADPPRYAGLIISGTGGPNSGLGVGKALADFLCRRHGARSHSPRLYKLIFGAYNRRFEGRTEYDWLSRNAENVDRYMADEKCGFPFTVSGLRVLLEVNGRANRQECFLATPNALPILLVSGTEDPVGDYGRGVEKVYQAYRRAGIQDLHLHLFPGDRHEIFNEIDREEVIALVGGWLDERFT